MIKHLSVPAGFVLLAMASCSKPSTGPEQRRQESKPAPTAAPPAAAPLDPAVAAVVTEANKRILARQAAVKGWGGVVIPDSDGKPCAQAPTVKAFVSGMGFGTAEARKVMVIESADEIAGNPDPSLPPSVAKSMAEIQAAVRAQPSPIGWAQMDYTTNEYPFQAGPRAKAFQFAFASARRGGDKLAMDKALDELKKDEVILIAEKRVHAVVHGETFTPGIILGVALLWSYEQARFVCAGRFEATTTSDEFSGGKLQVGHMPDEEVEVRAFENGVASLAQLSPPGASAGSATPASSKKRSRPARAP